MPPKRKIRLYISRTPRFITAARAPDALINSMLEQEAPTVPRMSTSAKSERQVEKPSAGARASQSFTLKTDGGRRSSSSNRRARGFWDVLS